MGGLERFGRWVTTAAAVLGTSALVIVGLLSGACNRSQPAGYCWRPGICYNSSTSGESLFSCPSGERFDEGTCPATLRVGACVTAHQSVYLYAPMHGLLPPDCPGITGDPSSHYVRD